jgi:hypothetical protein
VAAVHQYPCEVRLGLLVVAMIRAAGAQSEGCPLSQSDNATGICFVVDIRHVIKGIVASLFVHETITNTTRIDSAPTMNRTVREISSR